MTLKQHCNASSRQVHKRELCNYVTCEILMQLWGWKQYFLKRRDLVLKYSCIEEWLGLYLIENISTFECAFSSCFFSPKIFHKFKASLCHTVITSWHFVLIHSKSCSRFPQKDCLSLRTQKSVWVTLNFQFCNELEIKFKRRWKVKNLWLTCSWFPIFCFQMIYVKDFLRTFVVAISALFPHIFGKLTPQTFCF